MKSSKALISVYDKTGIVDFAFGLIRLGWEILASGGTAAVLLKAGLPVTDVADYTGVPPLLGHRVVTLHPRIHGGILADSSDVTHQAELVDHDIELVDLVVVNLYPFYVQPCVETIDIGGPTLLRAAAKNHQRVGVISDTTDYDPVISELSEHGYLSISTRARLAQKAFIHTRDHDNAIIAWLGSQQHSKVSPDCASSADPPDTPVSPDPPDTPVSLGSPDPPALYSLTLEKAETMRYGENPHQSAARYRPVGVSTFFDRVLQHGGVDLSYLNLVDVHAAWSLVNTVGEEQSAVVIVKHANPCGVAVADTLAQAYSLALECDRQSAFGGVVAMNREIDINTAQALTGEVQSDVVVAPGFASGVREMIHARRASTRILEVPTRLFSLAPYSSFNHTDSFRHWNGHWDGHWELQQLGDDFLLQDASFPAVARGAWKVVTTREPSPDEYADAVFAWKVCASVTSNAVVLARDGVAWGIGAGQPNRAESGRIAHSKAAGRASGGACASDGFYPFPDGIDAAVAAGVSVVVQPGGSINDSKVIAAANLHNLAMLFTGIRQFRH